MRGRDEKTQHVKLQEERESWARAPLAESLTRLYEHFVAWYHVSWIEFKLKTWREKGKKKEKKENRHLNAESVAVVDRWSSLIEIRRRITTIRSKSNVNQTPNDYRIIIAEE